MNANVVTTHLLQLVPLRETEQVWQAPFASKQSNQPIPQEKCHVCMAWFCNYGFLGRFVYSPIEMVLMFPHSQWQVAIFFHVYLEEHTKVGSSHWDSKRWQVWWKDKILEEISFAHISPPSHRACIRVTCKKTLGHVGGDNALKWVGRRVLRSTCPLIINSEYSR